ncbi:MAG TPA: hypothetical protein VLC46_12445 [Thermoanaerobaculia bacterium]|nr:hypothetical protein [Thermoanaerobaculia bacterium]
MLVSIQRVFAQHDSESGDRLARRDITERQKSQINLLVKTKPATNAYIKIAAINVNGAVSPSATFGLNHNEDQHPWFGEATYKHLSGTPAHNNSVSGLGDYQLWTGSGNLSPLLQADASYSNRPGSNEASSVDVTGEISRGSLSLDAIAAYAWFRPKSGGALSDSQPGLSAFYSLSNTNLLAVDYTFNNRVDGEGSFDIGFRHKLPGGYAVDVVVFKHNDVRLRIRKNFAPFRSRSTQ